MESTILTLEQYWSQQDPKKDITVQLKATDYVILYTETDFSYTRIKIKGIENYLYWIDNLTLNVLTDDKFGYPNTQSITCFKIVSNE